MRRQRPAAEAALLGAARPRLGGRLRPARRRHALAALAARDRARAVRLGRRAAGAARAREPRHRPDLGGRALRVRLRLPRPLRGQVAELRRARPRVREDDHARFAPPGASTRAAERSSFDADGGGFAAECRSSSPSAGVPGDRACDFEVSLPARCAWSLDVAVMPRSPEDGPPQRGAAFLQRERSACATRSAASPRRCRRSSRALPGSPNLYDKSLTDLNALRMRARRGAPDRSSSAAGLPWFMAPFGRDTLISSFQAIPLGDGPGACGAACAERAPGQARQPAARRRAGQDPARDALRQGRGADAASSRTTARSTRRRCT